MHAGRRAAHRRRAAADVAQPHAPHRKPSVLQVVTQWIVRHLLNARKRSQLGDRELERLVYSTADPERWRGRDLRPSASERRQPKAREVAACPLTGRQRLAMTLDAIGCHLRKCDRSTLTLLPRAAAQPRGAAPSRISANA